jgi:hypothetical protein
METLVGDHTTCTVLADATWHLYKIPTRQKITELVVTPYSLLSLYTFDGGYGVLPPTDLSYGKEEPIAVDWQHTDWTHDDERGVTIEMDGHSKAVVNITGVDLRRSEWTTSFWIKTKKVAGKASQNVSLLSQKDVLLYHDQDGVVHFSTMSLGENDVGIAIGQCTDVNQGSWTHIAVTYGVLPRTLSMYKNGIQCGESSLLPWTSTFDYQQMYNGGQTDGAPPSTWPSSPIYFGTSEVSHKSDIAGFRGYLSHWNLFSTALNEKQIKLIHGGYYLSQSRVIASVGNAIVSWINSTLSRWFIVGRQLCTKFELQMDHCHSK